MRGATRIRVNPAHSLLDYQLVFKKLMKVRGHRDLLSILEPFKHESFNTAPKALLLGV